RAPAVLLNIAWAELGLGAVRLDGGVHALVRALAARAGELGVRLCTGAEVEGLVLERGRVRAVQASGATLEVDAVVSAAERTVSYALAGSRPPPERAPPSSSGFVLLLGVEGSDPGGPLHTVLFPRDYRAEFDDLRLGRLPTDPTLYVHVGARSGGADAPPGHENWFVMVNAPPLSEGAGDDPVAAALPPSSGYAPPDLPPLLDPDGTPATAAETAYAARVLAALEVRAGLSRRRLRVWRLVGPRQLAATGHRGSIYGSAPAGLLGALRPAPRVPGVTNLALAGGTVHPGGGIPLALLSGRHAADAVLGVGAGAPSGPGTAGVG
ncbi:MAG: FAD-dependent oxidoreductase, partial [Deinococcales bacterium]